MRNKTESTYHHISSLCLNHSRSKSKTIIPYLKMKIRMISVHNSHCLDNLILTLSLKPPKKYSYGPLEAKRKRKFDCLNEIALRSALQSSLIKGVSHLIYSHEAHGYNTNW